MREVVRILSSGETTIEGEMSVVACMLMLEILPWEKHDPSGQSTDAGGTLTGTPAGFLRAFRVMGGEHLEQDYLKADIANRFTSNMRGYREKLASEGGDQSNIGRVTQNWAVLVTVYQMLSFFLSEMDENYLLPAWRDAIMENVRTLR